MEGKVKINLGKPFRVCIGRHTDDVYIMQGDAEPEERNGTVTPWSPDFAVGDAVSLKPRALHGLMHVTGQVECVYLAVNGQFLHVYGVRALGAFILVDEADLEPAPLMMT